jgi:hypothetical protein
MARNQWKARLAADAVIRSWADSTNVWPIT